MQKTFLISILFALNTQIHSTLGSPSKMDIVVNKKPPVTKIGRSAIKEETQTCGCLNCYKGLYKIGKRKLEKLTRRSTSNSQIKDLLQIKLDEPTDLNDKRVDLEPMNDLGECSICWSPFVSEEERGYTSCLCIAPIYHNRCLKQLEQGEKGLTCPNCRKSVQIEAESKAKKRAELLQLALFANSADIFSFADQNGINVDWEIFKERMKRDKKVRKYFAKRHDAGKIMERDPRAVEAFTDLAL